MLRLGHLPNARDRRYLIGWSGSGSVGSRLFGPDPPGLARAGSASLNEEPMISLGGHRKELLVKYINDVTTPWCSFVIGPRTLEGSTYF